MRSPGEVARRLGYRNVAKGANKLLRLERKGVADDDFVRRLAATLGISTGVVRYLIRADRLAYERAWEEWVAQPVPLRMVVRCIPGFMAEVPVPDDVAGPEQAVAYGQALAARLHKKVFVLLSRRESVGITESGEINGRFPDRPEQREHEVLVARDAHLVLVAVHECHEGFRTVVPLQPRHFQRLADPGRVSSARRWKRSAAGSPRPRRGTPPSRTMNLPRACWPRYAASRANWPTRRRH